MVSSVAELTSAVKGLGDDPDALFSAFERWAAERGFTLYPAQEEALLGVVMGAHVILATPTGTGKSLVAVGAHAAAMARGERSVYTAPIKALVSEKFFDLVAVFGAENVGMVTGDSSVNPGAPIVCCTAEILANQALREGSSSPVRTVVMDEFHFYSEPERGWAWQVPLLTLPETQFLLMSATLGDVDWLADDLTRRTGRETTLVTGVERPVPLDFEYVVSPVHETVERLLGEGRAPVYIVHFSQAAALERAQALTSVRVASRAQRDEIADAIGDFRFTTAFGRTLSRLVRAGVGVHHAGMLPRYRRLVETLAQRGLLRVICGTDTLGVGINVPIRTVLLTALSKFDGTRMRRLTAREFHQISGRAGRAGHDVAGSVIVQAPEHESENAKAVAKAVAKAGDDPKKLRKVVRKKPPEGFVSWGEGSLDRLVSAEPERLESRMAVSHSMLLNIIARGGDVVANVRAVLEDNHEERPRQRALLRQALSIFRTLRTAEVVEVVDGDVRLTVDLPPDFALNQPLSPFALAVFDLISPPVGEDSPPGFALDIISVLEATLEDPRPVIHAQTSMAKRDAVAAMKAEGIEYEQRMELLEDVTAPRPLADLLDEAFGVYRASQPWVGDFEVRPKSVVRDMWERAMTFNEYVGFLGIARSEGLLLRYLTDAVRTARQTIPEVLRVGELAEIIEWLAEMVVQVDSSLLDEWEQLAHPDPERPAATSVPLPPRGVTANERAFTVLVRNAMFRRVQLAAREDYEALGDLDGVGGFDAVRWSERLHDYWDEHDEIGTGPDARGPALFDVAREPSRWVVTQVLDDPAGHHDWRIIAEVDLSASDEAGGPVVRVTAVEQL